MQKTDHNNPAQRYKDDILELLQTHSPKLLSISQITKALGIKYKTTKNKIAALLETMAEEQLILSNKGEQYGALRKQKELPTSISNILTGKLDFVNPRYAYVSVPGIDEDIIVFDENTNSALDGDIVQITITHPKNNKRRHTEGEVINIVERANKQYVGVITANKQYAFVETDNKKMHRDIYVPIQKIKNAKTGDKVIVKIVEYPVHSRQNPVGEVIKVLGRAGQNETEMHAILAEFELPAKFPAEVEKEAEKIKDKITKKEIARRRDCRHITTITIDPVDAKDFDDAISIQQLENGNWEIGIHIADVTHYVTEGSALDKEAFARATSVYLVDRVVPMLPEKLSNGICSLRPKEDKLTFSAIFELDQEANIKNEWFGRTVIHSDRRFNYEEVQEIIETGKGDFHQEIKILNTLATQLREKRFAKGSMNFDTTEVRFLLDETGKPLEVIPKVRKDAHLLVEDFMLLANKRVAEFVYHYKNGKENNSFVYRVHEPPNPEKLQNFATFARKLGYQLNLETTKIAGSLNQLMEQAQEQPEYHILQQLAVRTMSKARYSTAALGHFGLAFEHYTHFTSPIRRYPDMMVHRLLQLYLDQKSNIENETTESACKHCSEREKLAAEAEWASIKYKQVEFMELQEPQTWEGVVSGITDWGMYVEIIATKCEGMIPLRTLKDDYYEFDAQNYRLVGRLSGKIFNFGDRVQVAVKETNLQKRTLDLELIEKTSSNNKIKSTQNKNSKKKSSGRNHKRKR